MSIRLGRILTATTLTAAITLTGCTNTTDPDPTTGTQPTETTPTEPTETTPTEPELSDRSDLVINFEFPTEPIAEATGAVDLGRRPAILKIYAVEAEQTTTRLIYQLVSTEGRSLEKLTIRAWDQLPMLDDTTGGKRYYVNTFDGRRLGLDTAQLGVYQPPDGRVQTYAPRTAQYPPLPAETTTVDVTMPGFEPITAPITRTDTKSR